MASIAPGISAAPNGKAIYIKVWRGGKLAHFETFEGDPNDPGDIARAKARREKLLARKELNLPLHAGDKGPLMFEEAAQGYLDTVQVDDDTQIKYENILNRHWMPEFTNWPVSEVTSRHIKDALFKKKISDKTRKNILSVLSGVMNYAEVQPNPCAGISFQRRRRGKDKGVTRYTLEQREALIGELVKLRDKARLLASRENPTHKALRDLHWREQALAFYTLLLGTGLRPGEALALKWSDYNGTELSVTKQHTCNKVKDMTKTGVDRTVYVQAWVRPFLDEHPTRFKEGNIFLNLSGDPLMDYKRLQVVWKKTHVKARVPEQRPYVCRHTRAAELLTIGIHPAEAADQLGHSPKMFLEIYSEFMDSYNRHKGYERYEQPEESETEKATEK